MSSQKEEFLFEIPISIEPDHGEFHAYCPLLKGLHIGGKTEDEALQNAKNAAIAYLISLIKHGDPIPIEIIKDRKISFKGKAKFRFSEPTHRLNLIKLTKHEVSKAGLGPT